MSLYGANFLRNLKRNLSILDQDPPDIKFHPHGYLFLANDNQSESLLNSHQIQVDRGSQIDILNRQQLKERFKWLNTDDITIGAHGADDEGWFDPLNFLLAMKGKAEFNGAFYLNGEVVDLNPRKSFASEGKFDDLDNPKVDCNHLIVRTSHGELHQIEFSVAIVAAGAHSKDISDMLRLGQILGLAQIPLPVEPRKRYVYNVHTLDGPGIDMPFLVDPSGVFCRRDGLGGNYLTGKSPTKVND